MRLQEAIRRSEWRKARSTVRQVITTVEQVPDGYEVSYRDQHKHFTTIDALEVFLGDEVVLSNWEPVQESEGIE